ncbi:MAG: polyphosphate kinase 2, partial [Mesorhizobium sp.]
MKNPKEDAAAPVPGPQKIRINGKEFEFDIEDPKLPDWIEDNKLTAGGYPYDKKMKSDEYD